MLLAVIHVAIVYESLLEGVVQRGRDVFQLDIVGLFGQQLGIVSNVEEGGEEFVFILIDRFDAIHALGGTVDGLLLCGIKFQEAVAQLLGGIDDSFELVCANHLIVAIPAYSFFFIYITVLPYRCTAFEHQPSSLHRIASLHESAHKFRHQLAVAAKHVGRGEDIVGKLICLCQCLYIAHIAVVEHERVKMVDACSLHGIIHLVHIHPFAIYPLVGHHTT